MADVDDLFGSDDDEEEVSVIEDVNLSEEKTIQQMEILAQQIITSLIAHDVKPKVRAANSFYWDKSDQGERYLGKKLLLWYDESKTDNLLSIVEKKLNLAGFECVNHLSFHSTDRVLEDYDAILCLNVAFDENSLSVWSQKIKEMQLRQGRRRVLMPGGLFLIVSPSVLDAKLVEMFHERQWIKVDPAGSSSHSAQITLFRKRAILCNETAAIYWTRDVSARPLKEERDLLEQIAVPLSVAERDQCVFSVTHRAQIVSILQKHGVVVVPSLHKHDESLDRVASELVADMQETLRFLRERHDVDLLCPRPEQKLENFRELSLREHRRCDLRSTPRLTRLCPPPARVSNVPTASVARDTVRWTWPSIDVTYVTQQRQQQQLQQQLQQRQEYSRNDRVFDVSIPDAKTLGHSVLDELRLHSAMLSVIHESLCPRSVASAGNWGRWNFEGPGPEAPQTVSVGQPGVVFSFPGCTDQTIHADTPHLFETPVSPPLAPHYLNYFLPMPRPAQRGGVDEEVQDEDEEVFDAEEQSLGETHATHATQLRGQKVGQTAFVLGSHALDVAKRVMVDEDVHSLLHRLVRPTYFPGDTLVFDCRILHFGLANQWPALPRHISDLCVSSPERQVLETQWRDTVVRDTARWRPMVYINCTKDWFQDPKNWNNRSAIYPSCDTADAAGDT